MGSCCHKPNGETPQDHGCCGDGAPVNGDKLFYALSLLVGGLYGLFLWSPAFLQDSVWLSVMAETTHHMVHAVWWGVAIGFVFVALLSKIPREFVMALLGKGGRFSGLLRATGAGVLLDLCSHGILMVGAKLYERGASAGQVIAFLLASPWNSFSLTLILIGLIGLQWTLAFIALSMVIALVTGFVFDRLVHAGVLPQNPNRYDTPMDFAFWHELKARWKGARMDGRFFREMALSGLRDSRMVVKWLLLGILIAGALRAFIDPAVFADLFGPTVMGLLLTIVLTTILEVCSEGSAPVAADIMTRANAPGNGFAFLMAGVATDYTEVMVIKETTASWKIALFLPLISVPQIVLVAWIINAVS